MLGYNIMRSLELKYKELLMSNFLELCQTLNMKLCHDMAGIIGAIDNCVDLMEGDDNIRKKAVELLDINTKKLISRLKFYRTAYSIPINGEKVSVNEYKGLISSFLKEHNVSIKFNLDDNVYLTDDLAKIILCLIPTSTNSFSRTGKFDININLYKNECLVKIINNAGKLITDQLKLGILDGKIGINELNPYNAHEYYTYFLIEKTEHKLHINQLDNAIEYYLV